jgi:hypothetical protein
MDSQVAEKSSGDSFEAGQRATIELSNRITEETLIPATQDFLVDFFKGLRTRG